MEEDWVFVSVSRDAEPEPHLLHDISAHVDGLAAELWPVNKRIHDHPELGYKERIAHKALTSYFKKQKGWKVTPSAYGLETAFVAVYDSGRRGPVVSFNVEMDALPEIGHACGHNLIATASVAGAMAASSMIKQHGFPGKIVVFGTPAEEGGGGKIKLIKAGAYRDYACDLNLISHPGITPDCALMRSTAWVSFTVEYFGRESHAAANPWLGINALDALITGYNALSVLRQQTMPGDIIQGHITNGGLAPNIIHAYTSGNFVVRSNTKVRREELFLQVQRCFEAGALATGAKLKITRTGSYADHVPNHALGASYRTYFNSLLAKEGASNAPIPEPELDEIQGRTMASTDQGDVSYELPSISAGFWIRPGKQGNGPHSPDFEGAAGTKEAFELALRVSKALAGTAVDALGAKKGLVDDAWREFNKLVKEED